MSKSKKEKPNDENASEEKEMAPWGCEIEFFNRPSFMTGAIDLHIDKDRIEVTNEDGNITSFPYNAVSKILVMHAKKKS